MSAVALDERELSEDEHRALDVIEEEGGLHQSELWKRLDTNSRKGSRLASNLVEKDLIEREETVHNSRVTYYLEPKHKPEDLDFSLLLAGDMISPFIGDEEVDYQSDSFDAWVINLAQEEY